MPADRLLGTLVRSLQTYTDQQDTPRLLGTASSLLTTLNNPLNVTLLTSQLLHAPALWEQTDGLRTCTGCLSVFHSAAQALVRHETARRNGSVDQANSDIQLERSLPKVDWIRAVVNGADQHSPQWRHLLVLGGLLLGFGSQDDGNLSVSMRSTVERALITAANLALQTAPPDDYLGQQTIVLVLNYCFPHVADHERLRLEYDLLLPVLMESVFLSAEGLRAAYFLGTIDVDVKPVSQGQFRWSERSNTFRDLQKMLSSPLISSLGPLSRLIAHAVEHAREPWRVAAALDELEAFTKTLQLQWRQNKLSEIDASEDDQFLDAETRDRTVPELWKLLRSTLFAVIIVLRSVVGRILADAALAKDEVAPTMATKTLLSLRSLYFISTRTNSASFSQYQFVHLTSMDILGTHPHKVDNFIRSIQPHLPSSPPPHPLDRTLDLFFLNTAEHFTLHLPATTTSSLLSAAQPYLQAADQKPTASLLPHFEAAHSLVLAIFATPANHEITVLHLPAYVDSILRAFPQALSPRQFRLAFVSLVSTTSPPAPLASSHPDLAATLLEIARDSALQAPATPLPVSAHTTQPPNGAAAAAADPLLPPAITAPAVLLLAIIDALPCLSPPLLEEWLPLVAELLGAVAAREGSEINNGAAAAGNLEVRDFCRDHLWRTLVGGAMDPVRAEVCHAWWSGGMGREEVLGLAFEEQQEEEGGGVDREVVMSGALGGRRGDERL